MKLKNPFVFNEFTVLGLFAAVVFIGLLIVLVSLFWLRAPLVSTVPSTVAAPTLIEYRTETRTVVSPFLNQATTVDSENLSDEARAAMLDLITATQERLLRIRVPGSEREAHLAFVILLDQWSQALGGSAAEVESVLDRTVETVQRYRWILPSE
jgi:hypothetical protein